MRYHSPKRRQSTRDLKASRAIVGQRSDGLCECCGRPLPVNDDGTYRFEFQHRKAKQRNTPDHSVTNGLALLPACHAYITANPAGAFEMGWSVEQHEDPARVPVMLHGLRQVWLRPDGTTEPVDGCPECSSGDCAPDRCQNYAYQED